MASPKTGELEESQIEVKYALNDLDAALQLYLNKPI
jgi:hypothetical protein